MTASRKVQVTFDDPQFSALERVARREKKKLAAVVRESVEKYCLEPAREQRKRQALSDLFALEPAPVPESYSEWERTYGALKTKTDIEKPHAAEDESPEP